MATKKQAGSASVRTMTKAELIERMLELEKLLKAAVPAAVEDAPVSVSSVSSEEEEIDTDIRADEYIRVVSLCTVPLNLSTLGAGKGSIFRFNKFGETKRIIYSDLVKIFESHPNFLQEGYFYVADKRVIRRHGLDDLYANILTKEQMEKVFEATSRDTIEIFKSATNAQKEFILDILVGKVRDNQPVDLNIIDQISRLVDKKDPNGDDFSIKKMGEESRKYVAQTA